MQSFHLWCSKLQVEKHLRVDTFPFFNVFSTLLWWDGSLDWERQSTVSQERQSTFSQVKTLVSKHETLILREETPVP